jgi:hypothetical protein
MEAHNFERNTAMNLRTTIKAMKLRTIVITGAVALACGAVLLLGMSSFAQQGEDGIVKDYILKAPVEAPKPPPEEPTEPESFTGNGSASVDVKVDRTFCGNAPAGSTNVCTLSGGSNVAAGVGNRNLVRLVVQVLDQIDGLIRSNFEVFGGQFFPLGGPSLEILGPTMVGGVDVAFGGAGHGIYRFFVRPAGTTANWAAGSYLVEVQAPATGRQLVQIDIP